MKLTIGRRIAAGYGMAILIMAVIGGVAYQTTVQLVENTAWVNHTYEVLAEADSLITALVEAESAIRGYVLTGEDPAMEGLASAFAGKWAALRRLTADNPSQQRRLDILQPLITRRGVIMRDTIDLRKKKGMDEALVLVKTNKGQELMVQIRKVIGELEDEERGLLQKRDEQTKASAQETTRVILFGGMLGLLLIAVIGVAIHRSITRPLSEFQQFVAAVGEGDLTQRSTRASGDELGKLGHSLNQMVGGLKDVASQTRAATENLNAAAVEILASAKQQAASTGQQAAACQETNTTMLQVSQSCLQITERAKQVAATVEAASAASDAGVKAVQNTNRAMESIREQAEAVAGNVVALSDKTQMVGDIIATVNDIAEQSHLLALNAAIEAAAAGEHGRSFAVVAGEIKNLADQSKEATVQVRSILGEIQKGIHSSVMLTEEAVKRVDLGKQQADLAASTIREMTAGTQQSLQAFQQIMAGTNQQQIGVQHVMQAVKDIGQSSDLAAASTRQMEKAAADLAALGQQLRKATDRYRV
jgi:methyl-accepting chemotaxis protein